MKLDHIVLACADVERQLDFYTRVIGLAPERAAAFRAGEVPFPSVRIDADCLIDLFPAQGAHDSATSPNLHHFCFALAPAHWEALRERLAAAGVEVEEGPVTRWGAHGDGVSIYFRDPEGNVIEARHYG